MEDTLENRVLLFGKKFGQSFLEILRGHHQVAMKEAKPDVKGNGKLQVLYVYVIENPKFESIAHCMQKS